MCLGAHIPRGNTYHCNTGACVMCEANSCEDACVMCEANSCEDACVMCEAKSCEGACVM